MARPLGSKGVRGAQRAQRGATDMTSSQSMDRSQFGAGSNAGGFSELSSNIQQGTEQNTQALGDVKTELQTNNREMSGMRKDMGTLKRLEQMSLVFEFSKFNEFGKTFAEMDKGFVEMSYSLDEIVARTEAGTRAIVKAITQFHSFMAGDSKDRTLDRMNVASNEQTDAVMKHRTIRQAQREFFAEEGITKGNIIHSSKEQKTKFDEVNRATSKRMEDHAAKKFKEREQLDEDDINFWRHGEQRMSAENIKASGGKYPPAANLHLFDGIYKSGSAFPTGPGGGGPGGSSPDEEITTTTNRRVRGLTKESLALQGEIDSPRDMSTNLKMTGKAKNFYTMEEFLAKMDDPKMREALLGKDLSEEWAKGETNMRYNPDTGSLMADRSKKKTVTAGQSEMIKVLKEIRDCVCDTFDIFEKGSFPGVGGKSGSKLAEVEAAQEASRATSVTNRSKENQSKHTKVDMNLGAASVLPILGGLALFGSGDANASDGTGTGVGPGDAAWSNKKKVNDIKKQAKNKKGKLSKILDKVKKILKHPKGKAKLTAWLTKRGITKVATLGWAGPLGAALGIAWLLYDTWDLLSEGGMLDDMLLELEEESKPAKTQEEISAIDSATTTGMINSMNNPKSFLQKKFPNTKYTKSADGRIEKAQVVGATVDDARTELLLNQAEAAAAAKEINNAANGGSPSSVVNAPTTNHINVYQPPSTTDDVLKRLLGGGIDSTLIIPGM